METPYNFRRFKAEDFAEYKLWFQDALLQRELGPMDDEWLDAVLNEKDGCEYSVVRNRELVAVIGVKFPQAEHPDFYLTDFAIKPSLRGKGFGSQILAELLQLHPIKPHQTWRGFVSCGNEQAKGFFRKNGWVIGSEPDDHGMVSISIPSPLLG